ncbi:ABC transporter substrate-binding protein [Sphingomonas changnyeongensis]|uniref:ABC transporter substrate-binding protein n=1 Tax=Sphingomonas changnyeongensis TaxID=2698679 RepID=A0A7Z2NXG0_9SPHN|nr:ABC transporter substrate-binding protein [Sphingomonas changnyeongensis]QHL91307.1 ABC transporter substrate-binding protein [Sphingomonas changnyeongensis]
MKTALSVTLGAWRAAPAGIEQIAMVHRSSPGRGIGHGLTGRRFAALLGALALLGGCGSRAGDGPIRASIVGDPVTRPDRVGPATGQADRMLATMTGAGLVTFDENGQIRPALAQRWIVTDDGLSAIFRLDRDARLAGRPVSADAVARRLRAALARQRTTALGAALAAIDEVAVMTPDVIEMRLKLPRPPLLDLLARPELAVAGAVPGPDSGGGFRGGARRGGWLTLTPLAAADTPPPPALWLRGEPAARALARFSLGHADLVLGGSVVDWPLVRAAAIPARLVRTDPAEGLLGLVPARGGGLAGDPGNRAALAMAIDRDALGRLLDAPRWRPDLAVLPQPYGTAAAPHVPEWATLGLADRRATAAGRIAMWLARGRGRTAEVRLFLPPGPGSRLMFAALAADWRRIGVTALPASRAEADLLLIDEVAPAPSAIWYLARLACPAPAICPAEAGEALAAARAATDPAERGRLLTVADRGIGAAALYIPIARPLRWSVVAQRFNLFRDNPRAVHPLDRLIQPRR